MLELNIAFGDLDGSGAFDATDLFANILVWGTSGSMGDIDGSGITDVTDLLNVIGAFGPCS